MANLIFPNWSIHTSAGKIGPVWATADLRLVKLLLQSPQIYMHAHFQTFVLFFLISHGWYSENGVSGMDEKAKSIKSTFTFHFFVDPPSNYKGVLKRGGILLYQESGAVPAFPWEPVRTTSKRRQWSRQQVTLTRSSYESVVPMRESLTHHETSSAPVQIVKDKNPAFLCCRDALPLAFCGSTCFPGAPEPIYFPSVSCLPTAILLHPRRFYLSQLERGEALEDIQEAPETLQVGGEDKQVHEPSIMISDPSALRHALAWLMPAWEMTIQEDLCLGDSSVREEETDWLCSQWAKVRLLRWEREAVMGWWKPRTSIQCKAGFGPQVAQRAWQFFL